MSEDTELVGILADWRKEGTPSLEIRWDVLGQHEKMEVPDEVLEPPTLQEQVGWWREQHRQVWEAHRRLQNKISELEEELGKERQGRQQAQEINRRAKRRWRTAENNLAIADSRFEQARRHVRELEERIYGKPRTPMPEGTGVWRKR